MKKNKQITFNLDVDLLQEATRLSQITPKRNITQTLNELIHKGLISEQESKNSRRREELILLKTLHIMRYLASTRSPEILEEIDASFQDELPQMKDMILEEGIDYVNG